MNLSNKNALILLLEINQTIEEYAEYTVKNIVEDKNFESLIYPPNCGLTDLEKIELGKLNNNEHLKNALRKIIADNTAGVIFNALNLLDGTTTPRNLEDEWTGVKLVDEQLDKNTDVFNDKLHDAFFESYWDWKSIREKKDWET
jgi:hypothetical protein